MVDTELILAIAEPFTVRERDLSYAENLAVGAATRLAGLAEALGSLSVHPDFEVAVKERKKSVETGEKVRSSDWRTVGSAILELCVRADIAPEQFDCVISNIEGFIAPVCIEYPDEKDHIVLSHDLAVYCWPEA